VLSTDQFAEWSDKVVLLLHNSSRVEGDKHPDLLYQMGGIGFPTVSYLSAEGRLLEQVGHVTPVEQLEEAFGRLQQWRQLRASVEGGQGGAARQKELFLLELRMGNRPYEEMVARRAAVQFEDADALRVEQQLVNLQFAEILRATPRDEKSAGGRRFLAMFRQNRIPDTTTETSYWQYMFEHAAACGDVALFEELLAYVKKNKQGDPRLGRHVRQLEQQLEQLRKARGG